MLLAIIGIGIVLNFVVLLKAADAEPEGAMGMGVFFLLAFIPYLIFIGMVVAKISDYFGWSK